MPVGLPHVSSTPQSCRLYVSQIAQAWRDFLLYLDLPSASLYWNSCRTAFRDVKVAASSLFTLGYLTFKPILLILWLVFQNVWKLAQFLAKHLFHQAYISAKKGAVQAKWACREFQKWQSSLSNGQVMIEISILLTLIGLYLLRRYIEKQNYVRRLKTYYRRKKRVIKENYRKGVRRVADTSLLLAMLMPHLVFLGSLASLKLFFPRLLTYLATDTYLLLVMSFWYPLLSTIGLLQHYRNKSTKQETSNGFATPSRRGRRRSSSGSFFPRTTPSQSVQKWLKAATTPVMRFKSKNCNADETVYDINEDATYWLEYWVVYSLGCATCRLLFLMPMFGRLLTRFVLLSSALRELQLVFFLWLFGVPLVTPELTKETKPLPLLYHRAVPLVQLVYNAVSNAISTSLWQNVVEKASSILDLAVMIKVISKDTQEWMVHVLQESRPVLPPALTLFMPGFLTEYGVLYVKTLVPCAKCTCSKTCEERMAWLEYWVLHGLVAAILTWWSPILWWIPFSTHAVFLLWCHLQIPKTTKSWYNILEEELQAFGLLESTKNVPPSVESTRTASMLRRLASSLPSASDVNNDSSNDDGGGNEESSGDAANTEQDGDAVMVEQEDANKHEDRAKTRNDSQDGSWSSDENTKNSEFNVATRRRSTRQRKKTSVY